MCESEQKIIKNVVASEPMTGSGFGLEQLGAMVANGSIFPTPEEWEKLVAASEAQK